MLTFSLITIPKNTPSPITADGDERVTVNGARNIFFEWWRQKNFEKHLHYINKNRF
jgi:hypothetical protein